MTEARLPHIARPVIIDRGLEEFQSMMSTRHFEPRENISLPLLRSNEIDCIPRKTKSDLYGEMMELANQLTNNPNAEVEVITARLFYIKRTGYLALNLIVGQEIGEERNQITSLLGKHGLDLTRRPFSRYRYQVISATAPQGNIDIPEKKEELLYIINAIYPSRLSLAPPTY